MKGKKIILMLLSLMLLGSTAMAAPSSFSKRVYSSDGWISTNVRVKKDDMYDPMVNSQGGNQYTGTERMDYRIQSPWVNVGVSTVAQQWSCNQKSTMTYDYGKGKIGNNYNLGIRLAVSQEGVANVYGVWEP